jgi:hypothetical protein
MLTTCMLLVSSILNVCTQYILCLYKIHVVIELQSVTLINFIFDSELLVATFRIFGDILSTSFLLLLIF